MSTSLPLFEEAKRPSQESEKDSKPQKASTLNDLDLENWREYEEVQTDSLW